MRIGEILVSINYLAAKIRVNQNIIPILTRTNKIYSKK